MRAGTTSSEGEYTVTLHFWERIIPLRDAVAVIVAVPLSIAVRTPVEVTLATDSSELVQTTFTPSSPAGITCVLNVYVPPFSIERDVEEIMRAESTGSMSSVVSMT